MDVQFSKGSQRFLALLNVRLAHLVKGCVQLKSWIRSNLVFPHCFHMQQQPASGLTLPTMRLSTKTDVCLNVRLIWNVQRKTVFSPLKRFCKAESEHIALIDIVNLLGWTHSTTDLTLLWLHFPPAVLIICVELETSMDIQKSRLWKKVFPNSKHGCYEIFFWQKIIL